MRSKKCENMATASKAVKLRLGYKISGVMCCSDVNVALNVARVNPLFTCHPTFNSNNNGWAEPKDTDPTNQQRGGHARGDLFKPIQWPAIQPLERRRSGRQQLVGEVTVEDNRTVAQPQHREADGDLPAKGYKQARRTSQIHVQPDRKR